MTKEPDVIEIQEAVRKKYADVSRAAEGKFKYPTGKTGAKALGYDLSLVEDLPEEILECFCGVGNPFSLGKITPGAVVLDVGCGTGFDLIVASRYVGSSGRVCGIDLTPEMVEKAQKNLRRAGVPNSDVQIGGSEAIPYANNTFDVAISNGVLHLSPLKEQSFQEIHRVLKPTGRLQCAIIVLNENLPAEVASSLDAWSD